MRRDKTLKVCANHMSTSSLLNLCSQSLKLETVSADMRLQPNIGSDRSWVWKVHADYADGVPTAETLAIRFATAECKLNFSHLC